MCRKQAHTFEQSAVVQKRQELERSVVSKKVQDEIQMKERRREAAIAARRADLQLKRSLQLQHHQAEVRARLWVGGGRLASWGCALWWLRNAARRCAHADAHATALCFCSGSRTTAGSRAASSCWDNSIARLLTLYCSQAHPGVVTDIAICC